MKFLRTRFLQNTYGRLLLSNWLRVSSLNFDTLIWHCVKSVQIQNFFWSVFSCIQSKYRKIQTRKNSVFGHFSRSESLVETFYTAMLEIWNLCTSTTRNYSLTHNIYKFLDIVSVGNLYWVYLLIDEVYGWRHEYVHVKFLGNNLWCCVRKKSSRQKACREGSGIELGLG